MARTLAVLVECMTKQQRTRAVYILRRLKGGELERLYFEQVADTIDTYVDGYGDDDRSARLRSG